MALGNLGFEDAGASAGAADLWTETVTVAAERMALFGTGGDTTETESFETEWDADYLFAFDTLDVTPGLFDSVVSDGEALEDFEEGWSLNHNDGDELSGADPTVLTGGDTIEDFEEGWLGNEDDTGVFVGTAAEFTNGFTGGDLFEAFVYGWNANEDDATAFTGGMLSAASFDSGGTPESVEDFEEVYQDKLVSLADPATDLITISTLHTFGVGDRISFRVIGPGALPAPLNGSFYYYTLASGLTTTAFKVGITSGGAVVDLTDAGVGAIYIRGNPARYWLLDP